MEDRLDGVLETTKWAVPSSDTEWPIREAMAHLSAVRQFDTGATRDSDEGKNDYEGYLSPLFLEAFGDYMTEHRVQSDGSVRAADNWQRGIPIQAYRESLIRHTFTAWRIWRGWPVKKEKIGGVLREPTLIEALCGIFFNVQGMAHEHLKGSSR